MEKLGNLKAEIRRLASDSNFVHKDWFVKYHIEIAEKIANELCLKYKNADSQFVNALIWFHDFGKLVDFENQHKATQEKGLDKLLELGFDKDYSKKILNSIKIIDEKTALNEASIEIKIASSADGASHLVGPFYLLYWRENYLINIENLLAENILKLETDWNKKIILPEIKECYFQNYIVLKNLFTALV